MQAIRGIHHISAMVGDLEKVLAFYRKILGLRLVKKQSILMIKSAIIFTLEVNRLCLVR